MKALITLVLILFAINGFSQQKAFPSAYGAGAYTTGGRGGVVYHVTNLNDNGAGSLRNGLQMTVPRIIVFDVSGVINLNSILGLNENNSNVTIAGQTAPEGGITIDGARVYFTDVNNVICRYIRFKGGVDGANDSFSAVNDITNHIFDHCSFAFGADEAASWYGTGPGDEIDNITIQRCFFAESKTGSIIGGASGVGSITGDLSFINNLYYNITHRFPNIAGDNANIDVINNVAWNVLYRLIQGNGNFNLNHIGNYYDYGNSLIEDKKVNMFSYGTIPQIYTSDNKIVAPYHSFPFSQTVSQMNANNKLSWKFFQDGGGYSYGAQLPSNYFTNTQFSLRGAEFTPLTADEAFLDVLKDVGCNARINGDGSISDNKDVLDINWLNKVSSGKHPNPLFEYDYIVPPITSVSRGIDYYVSDPDIPETWYLANVPDGATANDLAPSGYTWLNEFINEVDNSQDDVLQVQACALITPPVIDGTEDYIWSNIPSHNMGVTEIGLTLPDPSNLSANFKIAWDVNSLYFFIKVKDDILFSDSPPLDFFRDDAVSIYIDALDDDSVTYGSDDYYFGFRQGSTDININGSLYVGSGVTKTDVVTTDGYNMEVKIDWSYLGLVPDINNNIGLDFRVDDDDDGGSRENHVLWNDKTSTLWGDPSKFGILQLTDASCDGCFSKNAPVVSSASPMAVDYKDNDTVSFNISYTSDTTLSSVSYYLDGSLQRSLIASPFSFDTTGLDLGSYVSYAVVEDACGNSSSTSQVSFTVIASASDTKLQVQACKFSTPPVIDGKGENIWSSIPSHNMGVTEIGLPFPDPNNLSASFKIAWDVNSLYFFIKVKDDILFSDSPQMDFFRDDAVSIYIDALDDDSVTYGSDDYYIGFRQGSTDININSSLYVGSEVTKTDVVTAEGYNMEVKIDWSYLDLVPDINNYIGLDFRVDDDDDGGSRENHVLWNDETSTLWNNPSKFGILKLIDDSCPEPTNVRSFTKEEFSVFPNPATSELNIRTSGIENHVVSIYNSSGQEVLFSQINKSSFNIDINSWESGLYMIILREKNLNPVGKEKLIVN